MWSRCVICVVYSYTHTKVSGPVFAPSQTQMYSNMCVCVVCTRSHDNFKTKNQFGVMAETSHSVASTVDAEFCSCAPLSKFNYVLFAAFHPKNN